MVLTEQQLHDLNDNAINSYCTRIKFKENITSNTIEILRILLEEHKIYITKSELRRLLIKMKK